MTARHYPPTARDRYRASRRSESLEISGLEPTSAEIALPVVEKGRKPAQISVRRGLRALFGRGE